MSNKLKQTILFILPWLPYPLRSGGHQAIYNGLLAVKDDYNILITYQEPFETSNEENKRILNERLGNQAVILPYKLPAPPHPQPVRFKTRVHRLLRKLFDKKTKSVSNFEENSRCLAWTSEIQLLSKPYVNHVLSIIDRFKVDIVQCEMIRNAAFVYYLPDKVAKVFVHHEIAFVRQALEALSLEGNEIEKTACLKYAKAKEVGTLNLFDAVVTLSQTDTEKLKQAGVKTELFTSFAVVNTQYNENSFSHSDTLSFVGPSSNPPNVDAVKWFCENCWDSLLKKKNYQLQIVGHWNETIQKEILCQYKNIRFIGFVDDLANAIKDTVLIVPMTIGSGIRMKMLEAATVGIPIVSTSIGAEGLLFVNNEHCMIADRPEDFIEAIIKLEDEQLCSRLIVNAKMLVEKYYAFDVFKKNRLKIYSGF